MASQQDLFTFQTFGRKPANEQVTPYKFSLLTLVYEYQQKKQTDPFEESYFSEQEKRDFMITLFELLQSLELDLNTLKDKLEPILKPALYELFILRLQAVSQEGILPFTDFFAQVNVLVYPEARFGTASQINKSSVLGLFIRQMVLAFNKLSFSEATRLYKNINSYTAVLIKAVDADMELDKSLSESAMSLSGIGPLTKSALGNDASHDNEDDPGGFYSERQAEYFISQQTFMLRHNEQAALRPKKLQDKITAMLRERPDIAEPYFLNYLNNLRVKEYCTALYNLYNYFNCRTNMVDESPAPAKGGNDDVSRRYAALNLAVLHYTFGHKTESMEALQEAIRMAQEKNDHVCLQHTMLWLHLLRDPSKPQSINLMERSVSKSSELALPYLTSLGVQTLARHNSRAKGNPASIFDYLMNSDFINCQHSNVNMMCISHAQKAGFWNMYGKREMSSMCSQLVLHLHTVHNSVYHNGESVCIAMCNLAQQYMHKGSYITALDIINHTKRRFPVNSQYAHIWMVAEQLILFEKNLHCRKLSQSEQAAFALRALDRNEADLRYAILLRERGQTSESASLLQALLKEQSKDDEPLPHFQCTVLLALIEVYTQIGKHTTALTHVMDCITRAKEHHLQYIEAFASIHLAFIQFHLRLYQQALTLVEQHMLTILTNGSCFDKARTLYLYIKCRVAAASKCPSTERRSALVSSVKLLDNVVSLFQTVDASLRVKDVFYYQARLYHNLGYTDERNKCAYQVKQMDLLTPTQSPVVVTML